MTLTHRRTRLAITLAAATALLPIAACATTEEPAATTTTTAAEDSGTAGTTTEGTTRSPGTTTGTTRRSGTTTTTEENGTDGAIADSAVLTEDDLPSWTAGPAPSDDDEDGGGSSFTESFGDCGTTAEDLQADYGEAIEQVDAAPSAESPDFELETATASKVLANMVLVLPEPEMASTVLDLMADERMEQCLDEQMAADTGTPTAEGDVTVNEVDLGDRAVGWTVLSTSTIAGQEVQLRSQLLFVQVDRGVAMFMLSGFTPTEGGPASEPLSEEDLLDAEVNGAVDAVIGRLESMLG